MGENTEKPAREGKKKDKKGFGLSFYDTSDIAAQADKAYSKDMTEEDIRSKRKKDWLFLLIAIPVLIGLYYLCAVIFRSIK